MCTVVHARGRPGAARALSPPARAPLLVLAVAGGLAIGLENPARAEKVTTVFTLDPAPANLLNVELTITASGTTVSDTDTSTGSGMIEADLDVVFHPLDVTGLTFTGGRMFLTDVSFVLEYGLFVGRIFAEGTGISGYLNTTDSPGPVAAGSFPTVEHEVVLDQGTAEAVPSGLLLPLLVDPVTIDLSAAPVTAASMTTGTLNWALAGVSGDHAIYDADLYFPIDFVGRPESNETLIADLAFEGLLTARGQFAVTIPHPDIVAASDLSPTGTLSFIAVVEPGFAVVVESTEDHVVWTPRATNTPAGITMHYVDPQDPLPAHRSYRARLAE